MRTELIGTRLVRIAGSYEHGNKLSGYVVYREYIDWLSYL
jgi:hypothetical protein